MHHGQLPPIEINVPGEQHVEDAFNAFLARTKLVPPTPFSFEMLWVMTAFHSGFAAGVAHERGATSPSAD
jgi:hypothetical protein